MIEVTLLKTLAPVFGCVCVCVFVGLHLWHTEAPRLGVPLEVQLPAYTTATATGAEHRL